MKSFLNTKAKLVNLQIVTKVSCSQMVKNIISSFISFISGTLILLTATTAQIWGQSPDSMISESGLAGDISFLADDLCQGRASGTQGAMIAGQYIADRFRSMGLAPFRWNYTQSFRHNDTLILRNIVGMLHSSGPCGKYIIVCAHYDHLGSINGTIYNGADDNASGVAAMISIAEAFSRQKMLGLDLPCNLMFVAFDGKEQSMAGSRHFINSPVLPPGSIKCVIDIDAVGSDLVPVRKSCNYLIALGEDSLPYEWRGKIGRLCADRRYSLDLDLQFYGSRKFTELMYGLGDHGTFAARHIPTVFFTSGFHDHTYKATDDADIINIELLRKRSIVIYKFIDYICRH